MADGAGFGASSEGATLVVVSTTGATFTLAVTDPANAVKSGTVCTNLQRVVLTGPAWAFETWTVTLASTGYNYVGTADDELSDVAAALADSLDAAAG